MVLSRENEIVQMKHAVIENALVYICGYGLNHIEKSFYPPIKSCYLNIYTSNCHKNTPKLYAVEEIKCNLVAIQYQEAKVVFIFEKG